MDGKSWLTGQNWIDQFIGNCARAGNTDVISQITDYQSAHLLMLDTERSFPDDGGDGGESMIGDDDLWIARAGDMFNKEYDMRQ